MRYHRATRLVVSFLSRFRVKERTTRALSIGGILVAAPFAFGCSSESPTRGDEQVPGVGGETASVGGSSGSSAGGDGSGTNGTGTGGSDAGGDGATTGSGGGAPTALVPAICGAPIARVNTRAPDQVVGTGSPESCTEESLRAAVLAGGIVTFSCGTSATTITITEPLVAPADKDTVIDGADKIILDGGGTTQILRATRDNWYSNDNILTVQGLEFRGGRDVGTDFVARSGTSICSWGYRHGGGGAILVNDVGLHVIDCTFEDNQGPALGPDVAGGAIYAAGVRDITVVGSRFHGNGAANGGAIGVLHGTVKLVNVVFDENEATGEGANFVANANCPLFNHLDQGGAGGLGGAFYIDGFDPDLLLCGVTFTQNSAHNLGGALFRSAYWGLVDPANVGDGVPGKRSNGMQTTTFDRVTMTQNVTTEGGGGGAYVNNSLFTVLDSTFTSNDAGEGDGGALKITGATFDVEKAAFSGNQAAWGGAFTHWGPGADDDTGTRSDLSFSNNSPNDYATDNGY